MVFFFYVNVKTMYMYNVCQCVILRELYSNYFVGLFVTFCDMASPVLVFFNLHTSYHVTPPLPFTHRHHFYYDQNVTYSERNLVKSSQAQEDRGRILIIGKLYTFTTFIFNMLTTSLAGSWQ